MSPSKFFFLFFIIIFSSKCQDEKSFLDLLKSYIQSHVSNESLLSLIELVRHRNSHNFPDNYETNKAAFKNHINTIKHNKGYIEDQGSYSDMKYGIKKVSESGCGIIATYNVIYHITKKENIDFPSIIKAYENDGIILRGMFGTSMKAVDDYLKKQGYRTKSSSKKEDYDGIGQNYDAFVLTIYNSVDDITQGMHFIAITKTNGKYYVHNNGRNSSTVAYTSISDVLKRINGGKAKDVYLTGVKK